MPRVRPDSYGFFWQDLPKLKKLKADIAKREPPEPTWLRADYLPGLEEALRFPIELMSDVDLWVAQQTQDRFMLDTECYPNYWCAVVRSLATGKALVFEKHWHEIGLTDSEKFRWILNNICVVTFNGINYDMPMIALALDGMECDSLKIASDEIIQQGVRPWQILKKHKVNALRCDHIDLFEVAPGEGSLKAFGGRLHVPRMQDLPFAIDTHLTSDQIAIVRWYCVNDTTSTAFLHECLKVQIELRYQLSNENKVDLRSKSDAQIAEAIIGAEFQKRTGRRATRPKIAPGTVYYYEKPHNLYFQTPLMQGVLDFICKTPFIVGDDGKIALPKAIEELKFTIGNSTYQMGIGGLHSTEKSVSHWTNEHYQLIDADVESYYPRLILNQRYYPEHIGPVFLEIFDAIVTRRLAAKHAKNKPVADSLKIVINGTFGKLGSLWSIVYAPKLMFHVTIGGQLFLLMLTEALELNGIHVVSGNTDGIMIKCPREKIGLMKEILKWWENTTGFKTEGKNYQSIHSRDINSYIAIPEADDKGIFAVKHKGAYANPWDEIGANPEFKLKKNPFATICTVAVDNYLTSGTPLEKTIKECTDIRKFTAMVSVGGGAVKDGEYLGKQIRWYYSTEERNKEIVKALNGHKVGRSLGARPLMELPQEFPKDIDYDWYINNSNSILKNIGVLQAA